eukprot:jgi/Botrbrau1/16945/Bobra.49_2s0011.1
MATDVSPGSSSKPGWNYVITNSIKEDCRTPVWCICFNNIDPNHKDIFASCCGTQVTVYKLQTAGGIELIQAYVDAWEDEEFFACKFTLDERNGAPLLMAAGKCGILKVLDCHNGALHWAAEGHGDAINDIAVHARKPSIVVTASRDQSLRLWNVLSKVCLLVIGGSDGHRNEVLSVVRTYPFLQTFKTICHSERDCKVVLSIRYISKGRNPTNMSYFVARVIPGCGSAFQY